MGIRNTHKGTIRPVFVFVSSPPLTLIEKPKCQFLFKLFPLSPPPFLQKCLVSIRLSGMCESLARSPYKHSIRLSVCVTVSSSGLGLWLDFSPPLLFTFCHSFLLFLSVSLLICNGHTCTPHINGIQPKGNKRSACKPALTFKLSPPPTLCHCFFE